MQKRVVAILVLCLFETTLCYNAARIVDPFTFALEQFLSELTFEIVPYPNYPDACPGYQSILTYPTNPCFTQDGPTSCGRYPEFFTLYDPIEFTIPYSPCSNILDIPCSIDPPACNWYRDICDPCIIYDNPPPICICFEGFEGIGSAPYIYFPQVEYPMSAMDIRPYYYGSCWCT